jgi:F0F1-type ATP synthase assembly protein I
VKAQAKDKAEDVKAQARDKADGLKQKVSDVTPASVQEKAQQKPLPFAVGGALVAGFLLGRLSARD